MLHKEVSSDEIWRALKSMSPWKSPGPDGFPSAFFQQTWVTTGSALVGFVEQALEHCIIPANSNESLLVLIPKEEKPESIKGFRPISLCNVCIKLVTKTLVNRLKNIWSSIISPTQGAFVPGR